MNVKDTSGAAATYAIDAIADAVAKVSAQRSLLGAVQNRLEHTINNLDNVVENTTAAESQIRDTDMATEMVKYSNNNILSQAGQSMLAVAAAPEVSFTFKPLMPSPAVSIVSIFTEILLVISVKG